jgi:hypothetical protein
VVGVALGGVVGVVLPAKEGVFADARSQAAFVAVEDGDADAEGSEVYSGDDHGVLLERARVAEGENSPQRR